MPKDQFGRDINYLRISVIDHCNLRCVYCMPLKGLKFTSAKELLTPEEIGIVAQAAANVGFRKVRLTGGEPTLRADLPEIIRQIAARGIPDIAMTTNAILLPKMADALVQAGLSRVNIHVDTLNPDNLKRVMRFGTVEQIWAGIEAAQAAGLNPIKINSAVTRDYNDADVVDLARLTIDRDWHVRFIELMPFGEGECASVSLSQYVPSDETKARIETALGSLSPLPNENPSDESVNFRLPNAQGVVGFISPVSAPYCGDCNRMRLTSDGRFHLCLLNDDELDVKSALRNGGAAADVEAILLKAVQAKPTGHRLEEGIHAEQRDMFQIGG